MYLIQPPKESAQFKSHAQYNPLGLATPVKQRGAIVVRRAFQESKIRDSLSVDTQDAPLIEDLSEDGNWRFQVYTELSQFKHQAVIHPTGYSDNVDCS